MSGRGTTNKNVTGSSYDRRKRKLFLLTKFGDGETAVCSFDGCDVVLTFDTITVDRFPIMGCDGGTYARANVRGACGPCNSLQGSLEYHRRQGHTIRKGNLGLLS